MTKKGSGEHRQEGKYLLWLGNDESLEAFLSAEEGYVKHLLQGKGPEANSTTSDDEADEPSRLLNVSDGVAIITIHGPLTNRDSWMNRYYGLVSYNEIRAALVQAFEDTSVKQIMLDISSGGGSVAGVSDTANLIKTINAIKPITTFSDGNMASAAYWLGSSAGTIKISNTAVVGSIGVIMRHIEYSKLMEKEGITATVLREGKFKALMNPYEPLGELAKSEADRQMKHIYQVFVQNVAENLGASYPDVDTKMAQGREFVGSMAVEVGMVDGISSFDQLMGELVEKAKVSTGSDDNQYYMESTTMKKNVLSAASYAAAAAGGADMSQYMIAPEGAIAAAVETSNAAVVTAKANLESVTALATAAKTTFLAANGVIVAAGKANGKASDLEIKAESDAKLAMASVDQAVVDSKKALDDVSAISVEVAGTKEEPAATAAAGKCAAVLTASAAAVTAAEAAVKPAESPEATPGADGSMVSVLQTQLKASNDELINLKVEMAKLTSSNEALAASTDGLQQIARDSINKMNVALGGVVSDLTALSGQDLLTAHGKAADTFKATFKVGPVASTEVDEIDKTKGAKGAGGPTAEHTAAVAAASATQK